MKRATLYISGNVQHAGYRKKVISTAKALDIKGNIQNLADGRVKVIAEGQDADLERFIQEIEIKNALINVTNVEKKYSHATGEYEGFYKLVGEGETDERLDTAADLLKELIDVTKNGFGRLEKKQDIMIEKQDIMIEKQDIMIEKQDVMIEKQDVMIEKLDDTRKEIVSEIREMRGDLRSYLDRRLIKIEDDITEIKAKIGLS